ncbi:MAG TPA: 3D domain-containing protein [Pyrinomonadaceae bacterium]|nr:3D domain-containing protein [Pyrinomonadaceae bacterium]
MAKSLLGGGAALTALFSISLFFQPQPSVAETLAALPQQRQEQQQQTQDTDAGVSLETSEPKTVRLPDETVAPRELTKTTDAESQSTQAFVATAYSLRGRTASGRMVSKGIIAADRRVLPLGTRVRIDAGAYTGEYVVADTGGAVRGRKIDVWVPSTGEAMRFGRRSIKLTVLTYGGGGRKTSTPRTRVRK